jgi:PAS domain S-box-containing protein
LAGIGSWELDVMTGEITFSAGLARLMGLDDADRFDSQSHLELVHPEDRELVAGLGAACVTAGAVACEYRVIRLDASIRLFSLQAELVPRESGRPLSIRGAILDITEQREAERERLAAEDLFRQGFDSAPIGMSVSDPADGVLLRVNDAMCRLFQRPREELLGRPMSSFTHPDDTVAVHAARTRMLSGKGITFESEQRFFQPDGNVAWGMLHVTPVRRADGSIEAFYSQLVDITESKEREARLEHDVSDAVWLGRIRDALDDDRFVLYSQPIVDLVTGETVQNELLLRMHGDDGALIAPGEFLPAAERYGLISEIDRWVVRRAVEIAAGGTPTEFNLSGRSIGDPNIIRELGGAIAETGVDPSLLVIEVTETAFAGQTEAGREFAQRVRALGCRLALDDFGTGFSSLSYLKHLPADYLKVDIEFVRELTSSETDARVVRGIVGLAREFNQTTIAEGVEDEATLMMLKELGVDQAQGYLFGRPAPLAAPAAGHGTAGVAAASGSSAPTGCSPSTGCDDPIAVVRAAFDAFGARDLPGMLDLCSPDIVLRPFVTQQIAQRPEPYRGLDGVRGYLADVATVWDELRFSPFTFRLAQESVIGFGRAEGLRAGGRILVSIMWVVRLTEGRISSIEVFQEAGGPSMSPSQLERLEHPALATTP